MLGHRLPSDRKLVGQLPDRSRSFGQALHDGEPAGITQCLPALMSFESRHERKLRLAIASVKTWSHGIGSYAGIPDPQRPGAGHALHHHQRPRAFTDADLGELDATATEIVTVLEQYRVD